MAVERSPEILNAIVTGLAVPNNFAFLPHRRLIPIAAADLPKYTNPIYIDGVPYWATKQLTFCNGYLNAVTTALGCAIPPMKANDQYLWLGSNEGKMAGWTEIDKPTAIQKVALGYPVVIAAPNATGNGHVGVGVPEPIIPGKVHGVDLFVTAAGASNYTRVKMETSFGHLASSARIFTHP